MYRTHTCGELRLSNSGENVTLAGWVQRVRKMGGMTFVDLRDRYGITQLVFNEETNAQLCENANKLGREYVIQVKGQVNERYNKNANIPTGEIEIAVEAVQNAHPDVDIYLATMDEKLNDKDRYQTVYAKNIWSAAAPTAGLHFTPELLKKMKLVRNAYREMDEETKSVLWEMAIFVVELIAKDQHERIQKWKFIERMRGIMDDFLLNGKKGDR